MTLLLFAAVALLSFANGANDNFKGVATLWGAQRTTYTRALAWATAFTLFGSLTAVWVASGLLSKFSGSELLAGDIYAQAPFLVAVSMGAAATVLLAAWLGLPISTTHALVGALLGAGWMAGGAANLKLAALGAGVLAPLLFSPFAALGLTLVVYPLAARLTRSRDCLCFEDPEGTAVPAGASAATLSLRPALRLASSSECDSGTEVVRLSASDTIHWFSAAAISFARGLNDTPKIAALLLVASAGAMQWNFVMVAAAMAMGGALGAARVARTMSKKITPMAAEEAIGANFVAASLVTLASFLALPVSTTHVTSGGIIGIGLLHRKEANWALVRDILLSWAATVPIAAALAMLGYFLFF